MVAFDSSRLTAKEIAALLSDASASEIAALSERYAEDPRKQVQQALKSAQRRLQRSAVENSRVQAMYTLQRKLGGSGIIVGVDEVGRGPVAGPLTVGAVVLPDAPLIEGLNDSKKLSAARRETIAARIAKVALAIGMAFIEPAEIDEIGMSAALKKAMKIAIEQTGVDPDCVLIDGSPVHVHPREKTIVKGDAKIASIAAASIVAKVSRDALMVSYDAQYPAYHFAQNKGYASADHIKAIAEYGLTPIHRTTFCGNFAKGPRLF